MLIEWTKDPDWPAYDGEAGNIYYEIWKHGNSEWGAWFDGEDLGVFKSLEEAKHFCEMHHATGAGE